MTEQAPYHPLEQVPDLPEQASLPDQLVQDIDHTLIEFPAPTIEANAFAPENQGKFGQFLQDRWEGLGRFARGVRRVTSAVREFVGERFGMEINGYRLTAAENFRARLWRPYLLLTNPDAAFDPERYPDANPAVAKALAKQQNRQHNRMYHTEDKPSGIDYVKAGAYEILTLAPIRLMGVVALHGASGFASEITAARSSQDSKTGRVIKKIHERTGHKIEIANRGLDNPTFRRLKGYRSRDIKRERRSRENAKTGTTVLDAWAKSSSDL